MGHGALVMLVGEPGIGKTALCEQLCKFVSASGGRPLVGHCYEEGSFRPPYQPFVEVFGTYLQDCDTDALTADLGSGVSRPGPHGSDAARAAQRHAAATWRPRRGSLAAAAGRH